MSKTDIKTVVLDGSELCVSGFLKQNTVIKNLSDSTIYAATSPNIEPDADGVIAIPAGGGENLHDTKGTVYLLGTGKVQLTGTDYGYVNFKSPSSSSGGGGDNANGSLTSLLTIIGDASDEALSELIKF